MLFCFSFQVVRSECQPECSDNSCDCPDGMFLYNSTAFRNETKCTYPTTTTETSTESTTNTSTESTTTVSTVSTTRALLSMNTTNVYRICVSSCPVSYYRNESYKCFRCNSLCLNCTTVGDTTDVCACKYGDNSNGTCLSKMEDTGGIDERIIIGAGAGGGVLVVMIIIVVVCCCCRRRKLKEQGKSRMSTLLEVSVFTTYIGVIWYRDS